MRRFIIFLAFSVTWSGVAVAAAVDVVVVFGTAKLLMLFNSKRAVFLGVFAKSVIPYLTKIKIKIHKRIFN